MNTPFDNDDSDIEESMRQEQDQTGEANSDEAGDEPTSEVSLCQVLVPLPQKLHSCTLSPSEEMRTAVDMLGGDMMERWGHFLKKICIDASTCIFPIASPSHKGQLLYRIEIDRVPVMALLDHGASYSFMSKEWAQEHYLPLKPLIQPFKFSCFNGTQDTITHIAYPKMVAIGPHVRPWTFFVVSSTPMPVVLGLDAVRGWPLFYSPHWMTVYSSSRNYIARVGVQWVGDTIQTPNVTSMRFPVPPSHRQPSITTPQTFARITPTTLPAFFARATPSLYWEPPETPTADTNEVAESDGNGTELLPDDGIGVVAENVVAFPKHIMFAMERGMGGRVRRRGRSTLVHCYCLRRRGTAPAAGVPSWLRSPLEANCGHFS